MTKYIVALCVMIFLKYSLALSTNVSNTTISNKDCISDIGGSIALSFGFYQSSCPEAEAIVFAWVEKAVSNDPRMAASLLRLHFHDCFVNGCDASVLLDDTSNFVGEKTAAPNLNSLRGFEVIDAIKADLEYACPQVVSCADILAVAARDSVVLAGGPGWEVKMGRTDGLTASKSAANNNIPAPTSSIATLASNFQNLGLSLRDMVALSGAHSIGKARCATFSSRINNNNAPDVNVDFLQSLQQLCTVNTTLANLDHVSPTTFDNQYYVNILSGEGLLGSDQVLASGSDETRGIIESYVDDMGNFFDDFQSAMVKMGSLGPSTGSGGEVRRNCRAIN